MWGTYEDRSSSKENIPPRGGGGGDPNPHPVKGARGDDPDALKKEIEKLRKCNRASI